MTNGGSVVKFGLSPVLMTLVLAAAASLMAACVASPAEAPTPEPRSETTEVPATPAPSTEGSGIERQRARVAKMSEVSRRVTESWDLDNVLREVVDGARSLTGARYGAVGVFDNSGRVQRFITFGMTPEERQLLGSLPQGFGDPRLPERNSRAASTRRLHPSFPVRRLP